MKKLSSMVSTTILYAGGGVGWTALGLLRLFGADANLDVLEYILLIAGAAVAIIFMLPKRDTFDEMAQAHLMNALSWGFVAMTTAATILLAVNIVVKDLLFTQTYPIIIGVGYMVAGVKFFMMERSGGIEDQTA